MPRARVIDGRALAARVRAEIRRRCGRSRPSTAARLAWRRCLVGEDPASAIYVSGKHKASAEAGIESFRHDLPVDTSRELVLCARGRAQRRPGRERDHLPAPAARPPRPSRGDQPRARREGRGRAHDRKHRRLALGIPGLRPCTPSGRDAAARGGGRRAGGARMRWWWGAPTCSASRWRSCLLGANATITICHSRTRDLGPLCRGADILVAAVGRPQLVKGDWVKPGAVVIDVGINRTDDGIVGDVDYEAAAEVARRDHPGARRRGPDDDRLPFAQHAQRGARASLSRLKAVRPRGGRARGSPPACGSCAPRTGTCACRCARDRGRTRAAPRVSPWPPR